MMIIIFHAIAKGLLFLVVGTIENRLYTKDMENFDTLLSRMPRVSALALTGIAGMFIAPFGIVVAKWAAIRAFLEVPGWQGAALLVIMAFGSSLTIFYWGKLLIKVLSMQCVDDAERAIEKRVIALRVDRRGRAGGRRHRRRRLPRASSRRRWWGRRPWPRSPATSRAFLNVEPAMLVSMVVAVLFLPALALWASRQRNWYDEADFYAAAEPPPPTRTMGAALDRTRSVTLRNYYLEGVVNGALVFRAGTVVCGAILVALIAVGMVAR